MLIPFTYSQTPEGEVKQCCFIKRDCSVFIHHLRFYQIRAGLKVSPRVPHRVIATTQDNAGKTDDVYSLTL